MRSGTMLSMGSSSSLLQSTPAGLYAPEADVYLDPISPVRRALITHAHADHVRPGCGSYLTHWRNVPLLEKRYGIARSQIQGIEYGELCDIHGVRFSFHPAGHIPGSAQIAVESRGDRWVFTGDYKREVDGISAPFELQRCRVFITECTFGLPIFAWRPQEVVFEEVVAWCEENRGQGFTSLLFAYSLGKAQRLLHHLRTRVATICVHSSVWSMCELLEVPLHNVMKLGDGDVPEGALVIAPPALHNLDWKRTLGAHRTGCVSGWMTIRGMRRRRDVDRGFVLSDHVDFMGLMQTIRGTGAERVYFTHGYSAVCARYVMDQGISAEELPVDFAQLAGADEGEGA